MESHILRHAKERKKRLYNGGRDCKDHDKNFRIELQKLIINI